MTRPSGRKNLAIKVRECIGKGVATFVGPRGDRRVDWDIALSQKLLQHLPSCSQEITVAPLAPEFERALHWRLRRATRAWRGCPNVGSNDDLEFSFDLLHEVNKLLGSDDPSELLVGWDSHLGLKGNMILVRVSIMTT
jgi:hypothetical protein